MKAIYMLNVYQKDFRNSAGKFLEVNELTYTSDISFIPPVGMSIIIGENENDISDHEVEQVIWEEKNNTLYIYFKDFDTGINDGENEKHEWEYYDNLIKDFIEKDGWKLQDFRTTRKK